MFTFTGIPRLNHYPEGDILHGRKFVGYSSVLDGFLGYGWKKPFPVLLKSNTLSNLSFALLPTDDTRCGQLSHSVSGGRSADSQHCFSRSSIHLTSGHQKIAENVSARTWDRRKSYMSND